MKKGMIIILGLFITFPAFSEWINMKNLKVAVLDVVSRVPGENVDTITLTEMLQVALVDRQEFKIVERSLLDRILKEQEFQLSGLTDGQAAKLGALAGADKVMMVSVAKVEDRYILIVKAVDSISGIVDLTDQIMSQNVGGMVDLFPVIADRLIRKARGERLAPYQMVAGEPRPEKTPAQGLGGIYRAVGTNPDGSAYQGTCRIEPREGGNFFVEWRIGPTVYTGTGSFSSGILTVEWDSSSPVIYKVLQGGRLLEGLWAEGRGTETLTR